MAEPALVVVMRFVIATLPDLQHILGRDLELVKACALYGNESILYSPTYVGLAPLLDFSSRPLLHQLVYLALLRRDPGFVIGEEPTEEERIKRIEKAKRRSEDFLSKASTVRALLSEPLGADDRAELDRIAAETRASSEAVESAVSGQEDFMRRAKELAKAEELGLVRIAHIHDSPSIYFSEEKLKHDVGEELSRADSYGALDERFVGNFEGLSGGPTQKLRVARVAAELFENLPGFPEATLEEIRDIRDELAPHLEGFRRGIIEISTTIQSAPWDTDFPHEVERELQLRVHPAVAEIEEQVKANSYLKEIAHRAVTNPLAVPATSALGLVLSSATHVPALIGQVISGLAGAGLLAFEAHRAWTAKQHKVERNELFFYYRTSCLLKAKLSSRHTP